MRRMLDVGLTMAALFAIAAMVILSGYGDVMLLATLPALAARQADLDKILDEAKKLQEKYEGKRWDAEDRKKFDGLCAEGKALQDEIESETKFASMIERGERLRDVPEPNLPNSRNHLDGKSTDREVAGYISIGDAILSSEAFQTFARSNYATGQHAVIQLAAVMTGKNVITGPRGTPLVPLSRQQRKAFEEFMNSREAKAVPTLGTGVLDADRVARLPQVTADDRLTIRDIVSTGQTNATAVEYVREEGVTGAAATQTHGQAKAELSVEYSLQSAPVRTVAGWMPVQNQQLEDWAQLRSLIDGRLRYKVKLAEEQQILYGDGNPPNIEGLLVVTGTTDISANGRYNGSNHTLIDVVRMGITDVLVSGYQANAVVIHPYDWETILLEKGTDDRYVWAVVTDNNGSRIWGLRAVESVGTQATTGERNLVVGDFALGAQLLDKMQLTVQVGLVNDQFIKNMRTILAEERIAFPIYAPKAFAYFETQAAST